MRVTITTAILSSTVPDRQKLRSASEIILDLREHVEDLEKVPVLFNLKSTLTALQGALTPERIRVLLPGTPQSVIRTIDSPNWFTDLLRDKIGKFSNASLLAALLLCLLAAKMTKGGASIALYLIALQYVVLTVLNYQYAKKEATAVQVAAFSEGVRNMLTESWPALEKSTRIACFTYNEEALIAPVSEDECVARIINPLKLEQGLEAQYAYLNQLKKQKGLLTKVSEQWRQHFGIEALGLFNHLQTLISTTDTVQKPGSVVEFRAPVGTKQPDSSAPLKRSDSLETMLDDAEQDVTGSIEFR